MIFPKELLLSNLYLPLNLELSLYRKRRAVEPLNANSLDRPSPANLDPSDKRTRVTDS